LFGRPQGAREFDLRQVVGVQRGDQVVVGHGNRSLGLHHLNGVGDSGREAVLGSADDMPGASTMGGLDYLERLVTQVPGLTEQFRTCLDTLDAESRKQRQQSFANLPRTGRVEILTAMERNLAPDFFRALRDFIYEAYYTRPEIWQRLGYESHLTDHAGPIMKPFDETVLAQVRTRGKLYRETT
jgi:Gluconate 2-dehydrogenase subunit 3